MSQRFIADGGSLKSLWGEMLFNAVPFQQGTTHGAGDGRQVQAYKFIRVQDANLRVLQSIGARAFVLVETYTMTMAAKVWGGAALRLQDEQPSLPRLQPCYENR